MASALVNNVGLVVAPEGFLDLPSSSAYSSYGWLSPRISFSRDFSDEEKPLTTLPEKSPVTSSTPQHKKAPVEADMGSDFEFRCLDDPVAMLPADELFSDGKLVPLQLASVRPTPESSSSSLSSSSQATALAGIRSPEMPQKTRRRTDSSGSDPYIFSPRAPRCSSRWREILGLKRAQSNAISSRSELPKSSSSYSPASTASRNPNSKILKHFLNRNAKSNPADSSLSLPLLRDSDSESVSISSRLSLSSSSSSGQEHEDLPRISLDSDKPTRPPPRVRIASVRPTNPPPPPPPAAAAGRAGRSPMRRTPDSVAPIPTRGASVDSPRMNASGKIVFQGLERSSSSPGSFNGGPRVKHRGMERSFSANVRVKPVLNVPVCSLRGSSRSGSVFGFGQLFSSPQKKDNWSVAAVRSGGGGAKSERAKVEI